MIDDLVKSLRPDDVTEESYQARRPEDLQKAFAAKPRRRTPLLVASGLLAAAAAAFVAFAPSATVVTMEGPQQVTVVTEPAKLTARSVLLAGAETLAKTSREAGTYWHEKIRTFTTPAEGVIVASTDETWYDGSGGRTKPAQDVQTTFADAKAESAWRAQGRPGLPGDKEERSFTGMVLAWGIGDKDVRQEDVKRLPTDRAALQKWLDEARPDGEDAGAFTFGAARTILTSPASNETRAALLRILADQEGLRLDETSKDPLNRPGVSITDATGDHTLVVDRDTAKLLAYIYEGEDEKQADTPPGSVMIPAKKGTAIAYLESGWSELPE
ncbi:hypothetical protein [Herbidospora mongoliensis]|uniref:hypothetical protein n=1 Tax=Herbidospora mongoliensis TaxID=688067 RepID=UPI00082B5FE0|nr:hypothetical protein [Herbidospora mongoliensis]